MPDNAPGLSLHVEHGDRLFTDLLSVSCHTLFEDYDINAVPRLKCLVDG